MTATEVQQLIRRTYPWAGSGINVPDWVTQGNYSANDILGFYNHYGNRPEEQIYWRDNLTGEYRRGGADTLGWKAAENTRVTEEQYKSQLAKGADEIIAMAKTTDQTKIQQLRDIMANKQTWSFTPAELQLYNEVMGTSLSTATDQNGNLVDTYKIQPNNGINLNSPEAMVVSQYDYLRQQTGGKTRDQY